MRCPPIPIMGAIQTSNGSPVNFGEPPMIGIGGHLTGAGDVAAQRAGAACPSAQAAQGIEAPVDRGRASPGGDRAHGSGVPAPAEAEKSLRNNRRTNCP